MPDIKIVLDNSEVVYFPGSIVSGNVIIPISSKSQQLTQVGIELAGKGIVFIDGSNPRVASYKSQTIYIDKGIYLWKPENDEPEILTETRHFPFSFKLPENCPPSFKGDECNIFYRLTAERISLRNFSQGLSSAFSTKNKTIFDFTVTNSPINLSFMPELALPKTQEKEFENLKVIASIARSAFACGEYILLTIKVSKNATKENGTLQTVIKQKTFCKGRGNEKGVKIVKSKAIEKQFIQNKAIIYPNKIATFKQDIPIRSDLPPSFDVNTIIKVEYFLKINVFFGNVTQNIKHKFPIIISKTEIQNVGNLNSSTSNNIALVNAGTFAASSTSGNIAPSDLPTSSNMLTFPPSYSEALNMSSNPDEPPPPYTDNAILE